MLRTLALALVFVLAGCSASRTLSNEAPTQAAAATPMESEGPTWEERLACQDDVAKYCRAALPQAMKVARCLQKNRKKISTACEGVLLKYGL